MSFTESVTLTANTSSFASAMQAAESAIKAAAAAAASSSSSFTSQASSMSNSAAAVQKSITVYNSYGQAVKAAGSSGTALTGSLGQISSSANSSQGAIKGFEAGVANSATTTNNANSAIKFYSTSLTSSGTASAAAGTKFNAMGQAISTNVDAAQKTSTSFGALNNVMGKTSQATETTAQSTQKMGVNFSNAVGFMGAAIGSGVQLFETFESLERAQVGVDRASNALQTSQIKETSLQNQLNKMTAAGDTNSAAYRLTEEKLALQHEKTTTASDRLQLKQNDLNVTYADFAKNIIPEVISVGGTMIGALGNMGVSTAGLKEKFSSLIPALTGGATGMRGFGAALASIALNPFVLGLTAVAALLLAYKFNIGGTRDLTNQFGVEVGKINPVLKLMGDSLLLLGNKVLGLGLNEDELVDKNAKDWADVGNAFNLFLVILQRGIGVAAEAVSNFFAPITGGFSRLAAALDPVAAAIEGFFSNLSASLDPAAAAIESALTAIGTAISNFFKQALAARDEIDKWLDDNIVQPIIKAIQAIPGKLQSAAVDLVAVVWQALKAASRVITDAVEWLQQNIVTPITSAILSIPSRLTSGFVDIAAIIWTGLKGASRVITDAPAWLFANIITPIVNAVKAAPASIASAMGRFDLGKTIWDTLIKGSTDLGGIVSKWLGDNILLPFAKALDGLAKAFPQAANAINPIITKLWDGINKLSGAQQQNAQAAKVQGASYNELGGHIQFVADTLDETNGVQGVANEGMLQGAQASEQLTAAQAKEASQITTNLSAVKALSDNYKVAIETSAGFSDSLTKEDLEANRTLAVYNQMGAALNKLKDDNKTAGIEVDALSKLMQESTFIQELQTKGVNEQAKALLSTEQETAVMQGKLQELNGELSTGEAQWVSYQNGIAKADLEFAQNEQKIAASQGELESLNAHLRDGSATWQAYQQGIVAADIEYDKFITSSVEAGAKQLELNNMLRDAADSFGGLPGFIEPTISNLEAFVKAGMSLTGVLRDNGEAFQAFKEIAQKSFDEATAAGQEFFNKLVEASGKGGQEATDAFAKAWDELPNAVKQTLDETDRVALTSAAQFAQAGKQAGEAFSLKLMAGIAEGKPWDQAVNDARTAAQTIIDDVGALSPEMKAKAEQLFGQLSTASAAEIPKILAEAQKIPGPIGEIAAKMAATFQSQGWDPTIAGAQNTNTQTKAALTDIPTAAQTFGQIATLFQQQVEQTLPRMAQNAASGVAAAVNTVPGAVNTAFSRAAGNAGGYLATIMRNAQSAFTTVGNAANAVVGPINSAFSRAASAATSAFNTIRTQATSAFNAVGQAAASAGSKVASAMNGIASSVNKAISTVRSLISALNSIPNITRTVTIIHRDVYQSSGGFFQRGGLITGSAAARGPFLTSRQQKYRGATIGEAGKPELVIPLSKRPGDLADKSISIKKQLQDKLGGAATAGRGGAGEAGKQEVSVKGTVTNNVPININIDGKRIMSTVQRQLLEFSDATV